MTGATLMRRTLAAAVLSAALLAGCGADDNGQDGSDDTAGQTAGSGDDDSGGAGTGDDGDGDGSGSVEPGEVPEAGTGVVEVDGQTFEGEVTVCSFSESDDGERTGMLLEARTEHEGQEATLSATGGRAPGSDWRVQAMVIVEDEVLYRTSNVTRAAVDGPNIVIEGDFVSGPDGGTDAGQGRFAFTCNDG